MKILIVGAGAVGTVYGRHLVLGGADVSFYVREKYLQDLLASSKQGLLFYLWNKKNKAGPEQVLWKGFGVLSRLKEVEQEQWDAVILSTSSTGLRGEWLEPFLKAIGNASTLVTLQPGLHDREYLTTRFPVDRLVEGSIPIVSYFAPMEDERLDKPGVAVWLPPGAKVFLSGNETRVRPLLELFNRGGLRASLDQGAKKKEVVPGTVLSLFIAALKASGWSFQSLQKGPELRLACQAMHEIIPVLAKNEGISVSRSLLKLLLTPGFFKALLWVSRFLVPFDFERYLKLHFTKVGEQMAQNRRDMIEVAQKAQVTTPALLKLNQVS